MIRSAPLRTAIIVGLALGLLACGKKMPPRPPVEVAPRAVTGLSARLTEKAIVLVWKAPTKRRDGSPLERLSGFRVLRAVSTFAQDCPGCPVRYRDVFKVPWPGLKKEAEGMDRMEFMDTDIAYKHKYVYTVQAMDDAGRIGDETGPVTVYWDAPPGPPVALKAQAGEERIILSWEAPERLSDGALVTEPLHYYLYRRKGEGPYEPVPQAGFLRDTLFSDTPMVSEISYTYKVRAVRSLKGTLIEGPDSKEVQVFLPDITPPVPPSGLLATAAPEGVTLTWVGNTEADLAGYRVYRRAKGEDQWQRLSSKLEENPRYTDRGVRKGGVYYYAVTAVDSSPRQNESLLSFEVKVLVE